MKRTLVVPLVVLLSGSLVAPASAQSSAAEPNPWAAYYPAAGATCTSVVTHADGTTTPSTTQVLSKTDTTMVLTTDGQKRTWTFLSGGRLQSVASSRTRTGGMAISMKATALYPSPTELVAHGKGSSQITLRMTLAAKKAALLLIKGRELTATVSYGVQGLGERTITLGDEAQTQVTAVGAKISLSRIGFRNLRPQYVKLMSKQLRPQFLQLQQSGWIAPGLGAVQSISPDEDGRDQTKLLTGCAP